jgi:hypothetical protein
VPYISLVKNHVKASTVRRADLSLFRFDLSVPHSMWLVLLCAGMGSMRRSFVSSFPSMVRGYNIPRTKSDSCTGRFGISVVDNLVLIHHQISKVWA